MQKLELSTLIDSLKKWIDRNDRLNLGEPQAAVLVPFIERNGIPHIILTKRSNNLDKHSGQIAFPGGKVDNTDRDIISTAIREAEEEIGIDRNDVTILGLFDDFFTPYFSSVTPVIAKLSVINYKISEAEIDEVIEVPISDLLKPEIYHSEYWFREGKNYEIHFYNWYDENTSKNHKIWGATADVLFKLLTIIAK